MLKDLTVQGFTQELASNSPAPGGGSVAALEGALGAALAAMVGGLTQGRKAYAEHWELAAQIAEKAAELQNKLTAVMDEDTRAYLAVTQAYAMPKDTDEQKAARSNAIQEGMKICTAVPFSAMELIWEALQLCEQLLGRSNKNAASDLGVAALTLGAAVRGAWLNVKINIASLKDRELAESYKTRGEAILAKALPAADRIYSQISRDLDA